ncbi:MAG TPA: oxygenase MpaB family protein, partial [Myxococcaceae bacterium]
LADAAVEALAPHTAPVRERLVDQALRGELRGVPPELRALREALGALPFWADLERARRGGEVLLKSGFFGGIVLGFRSLVAGYCSPAGNKPLAFSGRLREAAPRRLSETSRFVSLVYQPGSFAPGAPGWVAAARVRLMHAQIRRMLRGSPRWDAGAWGAPINQVDMAGTTLLFSLVLVDGLRMLGFRIDREDCEDVLHLWRIGGWVLGVDPELLCATEPEARVLWELLESTQAPPDADSAALAAALLEGPVHEARTAEERARAERFLPVAYGIGRYLVGDRYADALGYPRTPWRFAAPALRALISGTGRLVGRLPGIDRLALEAGIRYWRRTVEVGLGGREARFELPGRVSGA